MSDKIKLIVRSLLVLLGALLTGVWGLEAYDIPTIENMIYVIVAGVIALIAYIRELVDYIRETVKKVSP